MNIAQVAEALVSCKKLTRPGWTFHIKLVGPFPGGVMRSSPDGYRLFMFTAFDLSASDWLEWNDYEIDHRFATPVFHVDAECVFCGIKGHEKRADGKACTYCDPPRK